MGPRISTSTSSRNGQRCRQGWGPKEGAGEEGWGLGKGAGDLLRSMEAGAWAGLEPWGEWDGRTEILSRVLLNIVPFGSAAQKLLGEKFSFLVSQFWGS